MAEDRPIPPDVRENPFTAPRASLEESIDPGVEGPLVNGDLLAFAGSNGHTYVRKWSRSRDGSYFRGWNWAAAIFTTSWLFYRKMYREGLLALGLWFLMWQSLNAVARHSPVLASREFWRGLSITVNIVFAATFGLLGNFLYLRRAMVDVRLLPKELPFEKRQAILRRKGGPSFAGLLLGLVLRGALIQSINVLARHPW